MSQTKRWPIIEIFGPTIQGEGVDQGVPCSFVRLGACDFRCTWCDTPHAVLPGQVAANKRMLKADEILHEIWDLQTEVTTPWVILSGGNPAMHDLSELVSTLKREGYRVAVETQGSLWKPWLGGVDRLCISPKPPSSRMTYNEGVLESFLEQSLHADLEHVEEAWSFLKVVVFTEGDLDWAEALHDQYPQFRMYLSAGNDAGATVGQPLRVDRRSTYEVRNDLAEQGRWLAEEVLKRPALVERHPVRVQMQQHVLYWGNVQGV